MEERSGKPTPTVTFVYIRVFRFTSKSEFRLYAWGAHDKATDQKNIHRQQQQKGPQTTTTKSIDP